MTAFQIINSFADSLHLFSCSIYFQNTYFCFSIKILQVVDCALFEAYFFEHQSNIQDVIANTNIAANILKYFVFCNAFKALMIWFFSSQYISNIMLVASYTLNMVSKMLQNSSLKYLRPGGGITLRASR